MALKKISTKAKNKERMIPESLRKKLTDPAFHEYQNELIKLAAPWQFYEPQRLEYRDRIILERQDYINYYFNDYIDSGSQFDEIIFLETLVDIFSKAKHPYFIGYRKFAEEELILVNKLKPSYNKFIRKSKDQLSEQGKKGKRKPDIEKIDSVKSFLTEHPISSPTPQKIFNALQGRQPTCTLSWLKKHIKKFTL
jgi:ribosomal protein L31